MGNFNDIHVNTNNTSIKSGKNTVLGITGKNCSAFRPRNYLEKLPSIPSFASSTLQRHLVHPERREVFIQETIDRPPFWYTIPSLAGKTIEYFPVDPLLILGASQEFLDHYAK